MRRLICLCLCFAIVFPLLFLSGCVDRDALLEAGESGYADGYKDGLDNGYDAGYDEGYNAGYEAGFADGKYGSFDVPPSCDYVLNKSTKRFHLPYCASVADIAEKNREYFSGSRSEVTTRGYSPCKRCNP